MSSPWPRWLLGNSRQREMLLKWIMIAHFNSHKHYSVGSRTIGSRLYQFCLLDVLWESSSALAYTPQVSFLTSKISWCYSTQRIQSKQRFLKEVITTPDKMNPCSLSPFLCPLFWTLGKGHLLLRFNENENGSALVLKSSISLCFSVQNRHEKAAALRSCLHFKGPVVSISI